MLLCGLICLFGNCFADDVLFLYFHCLDLWGDFMCRAQIRRTAYEGKMFVIFININEVCTECTRFVLLSVHNYSKEQKEEQLIMYSFVINMTFIKSCQSEEVVCMRKRLSSLLLLLWLAGRFLLLLLCIQGAHIMFCNLDELMTSLFCFYVHYIID